MPDLKCFSDTGAAVKPLFIRCRLRPEFRSAFRALRRKIIMAPSAKAKDTDHCIESQASSYTQASCRGLGRGASITGRATLY